MAINNNLKPITDFLADRLSIKEDSAHEHQIIDSISRNVEFKGANLWSLIFAIFIASIGLNVNSTAVIIGAMLVSPLMGPIMGFGLGIGINDIELIRRALKNLLIAVIFSVAVSAFYFFVTPLHLAQSELLARTTPSIWDVFIAIFGGLAGIVGGTRKEKSNVIPGVAIATALMPPLCTAGFGLANGNWYYFLGAFYLFFINSVFICTSTYLVVRYMKLPKKEFEDKTREARIKKYILYVIIATSLPSIYLAYKIVDKSIFESNADKFVKEEFKFKGTHIISKTFNYDKGQKTIDLLLIGEELTDGAVDTLKAKLKKNISGAHLTVSQGVKPQKEIDFSQIKASIIEDVFARQIAAKEEEKVREAENYDSPELKIEMHALYPDILYYSITHEIINRYDSTGSTDTVALFVGRFEKELTKTEKNKFRNWLKTKVKSDSIRIYYQTKRKIEQI